MPVIVIASAGASDENPAGSSSRDAASSVSRSVSPSRASSSIAVPSRQSPSAGPAPRSTVRAAARLAAARRSAARGLDASGCRGSSDEREVHGLIARAVRAALDCWSTPAGARRVRIPSAPPSAPTTRRQVDGVAAVRRPSMSRDGRRRRLDRDRDAGERGRSTRGAPDDSAGTRARPLPRAEGRETGDGQQDSQGKPGRCGGCAVASTCASVGIRPIAARGLAGL